MGERRAAVEHPAECSGDFVVTVLIARHVEHRSQAGALDRPGIFPVHAPSRKVEAGAMADPQPEDRRRRIDAQALDTDSDGDGVSDRDERAAGSDPNDSADVPIDLGELAASAPAEPAAPAEPTVPNKEFWEQHYNREVQADGSIVISPKSTFDAPATYTGSLADMKVDTDGDGLTNWEEFQRQTDPTNPDTDGDGRSDGDEFNQGFDPTSPTPPNATPDDQDGDGISDLDEIRLGDGGGFTVDKQRRGGTGNRWRAAQGAVLPDAQDRRCRR